MSFCFVYFLPHISIFLNFCGWRKDTVWLAAWLSNCISMLKHVPLVPMPLQPHRSNDSWCHSQLPSFVQIQPETETEFPWSKPASLYRSNVETTGEWTPKEHSKKTSQTVISRHISVKCMQQYPKLTKVIYIFIMLLNNLHMQEKMHIKLIKFTRCF